MPLLPEHMRWLLRHPLLQENVMFPFGDGRVARYDAATGDIVVLRDGRELGRIPTRAEEGADDEA